MASGCMIGLEQEDSMASVTSSGIVETACYNVGQAATMWARDLTGNYHLASQQAQHGCRHQTEVKLSEACFAQGVC